MGDQFGERRVRTTPSGHVQFVANQLAFIDNVTWSIAVLQSPRHGERIRSAGALGDGVIELRDTNVPRDPGVLLFELEVSFAESAIG